MPSPASCHGASRAVTCGFFLFHVEGQEFQGIERELRARELELFVILRIAYKDRVPGTLTHHVSMNEVVQTDNGSVLLRQGQIGNLSIL